MDFSTPISVHFLIHEEYEHTKEVRKFLYKILCRDSEDVTFDGLDIPVYFHIGSELSPEFPKVNDVKTDTHVIVPLFDDSMVCDKIWDQYINEIKGKHLDYIYPVVLSDYAFDMDKELSNRQFIRLKTNSILDNKTEFAIRIYEILNRVLLGNPKDDKLKLFISHSKRDIDNKGEQVAIGLRDFINSKTKLSTFFDANDILDGLDFEDVIMKNVESSFFVLVHSDTYSDREWCRKEILKCKANNVPAIRVDTFNSKCNRVFPYMANIPSIRFADNWDEIVALMLRTALDWKYQEKYLKKLCHYLGINDSSVEPTIPELLAIHKKHKDDDTVIYPEPPMGLEELEVLTTSFDAKKFLTPMQILTKDIDLHDKKIAISISEPSDSDNNLIGSEALSDLAIELARHLLAAKAQLVYGGDLRPNGFTEQLAELSYQYYKDIHEKGEYHSFHNFVAWPLYNNLGKRERLIMKKNRIESYDIPSPSSVSELDKHKFIAPDIIERKLQWAESLTKMRHELENFVNAVIAVGGRTTKFKGFLPGIIEEVSIAMQLNRPIYLIGAAGGCGRILADTLLKKITPEQAIDSYHIDTEIWDAIKGTETGKIGINLFNELYSKGLSSLNNGLSDNENVELMTSTNLTEIVALILKGLKNKLQNA